MNATCGASRARLDATHPPSLSPRRSMASIPTDGKGKKGGKKGTKGKDNAAAAPPEETHRCFHCQSEGAKMMCCSQCHRAQVVLWQAVPEEALEAAQEGLRGGGGG